MMGEEKLNKKVEAAFEKILRTRSVDVSLQEADEMVAKRKRLLAFYTQPGISSDLKEAFEGAIELTDTCHKYGRHFATTAAEQISSLPNMSRADLLVSARLWFESEQLQAAGQQFSDKFRKLHDDVLRVLVNAANDPSRAGDTMTTSYARICPGYRIWK